MQNYQVKKASETGFVEMIEGIERKTLVYGEKTILTQFRLAKGKSLSSHRHLHEQTGYLISGHIVFIIDGEKHEMNPGDSWNIKSNTEHSVEILMDSLALEVFSPVREDFI